MVEKNTFSNVYDLSTVVCRFYNVYGPQQIEDGTDFAEAAKEHSKCPSNKDD